MTNMERAKYDRRGYLISGCGVDMIATDESMAIVAESINHLATMLRKGTDADTVSVPVYVARDAIYRLVELEPVRFANLKRLIKIWDAERLAVAQNRAVPLEKRKR